MTCFHWVCKITVKYGSILYLYVRVMLILVIQKVVDIEVPGLIITMV